MRNLKGILTAIVLAAPALANAGGGLGGIVFDPSNFGQNTTTAAKSIVVAKEAIKHTAEWVKQIQRMDQNLKQLIPEELRGLSDSELMGVLRDVNATYRGLQELGYGIDKLEDRFQEKVAAAKNLNLTVQEYAQRQLDEAARGRKASQQAINEDIQALRRVEKTYEGVRAIQAKVPKLSGNMEAMQMMNQSMGTLIATTAELHTHMAQQSLRTNTEKAMDEADRAAANERIKAYDTLNRQHAAEAEARRKAQAEAARSTTLFK